MLPFAVGLKSPAGSCPCKRGLGVRECVVGRAAIIHSRQKLKLLFGNIAYALETCPRWLARCFVHGEHSKKSGVYNHYNRYH